MEPNAFYIPPRTKLRFLAVDLDGTLAWSTWKPDQTRSVVGDPIPENVAKLKDAYAAGYQAIIHTSRHWSDYELIEEWLKFNQIPYEGIICGKPLVHAFIDDKNINARDERWF